MKDSKPGILTLNQEATEVTIGEKNVGLVVLLSGYVSKTR